MNLVLSKYTSPNNYINKNTTMIANLTGTLREETSVLDPVFTVESDTNLSSCNYAYCSDMGRYYYITDNIIITNKLWELHCHVDVLMTYKPQILAHDAIIAKSADAWNLYLNDGKMFKVQQNNMIVQKTFPSGFTGQEFVLVVSGAV